MVEGPVLHAAQHVKIVSETFFHVLESVVSKLLTRGNMRRRRQHTPNSQKI